MKEIKNYYNEFKPKKKIDNLIISCNKLRNNYDKEELLSFRTQFVYQGKLKRNIADIIKTAIQAITVFMVIVSLGVTLSTQGVSQMNLSFYEKLGTVNALVNTKDEIDKKEITSQVTEIENSMFENTSSFFKQYILAVSVVGVFIMTFIGIGIAIIEANNKYASYYEALVEFIDKK